MSLLYSYYKYTKVGIEEGFMDKVVKVEIYCFVRSLFLCVAFCFFSSDQHPPGCSMFPTAASFLSLLAAPCSVFHNFLFFQASFIKTECKIFSPTELHIKYFGELIPTWVKFSMLITFRVMVFRLLFPQPIVRNTV